MRNFVIFLMMFVCVGISAQQKKQVTRKSAVNTEEHLTFLGVPISGKYESLKAKLRAKGLKNQNKYCEMHGKIYGIDTDVDIEKDDNGNVYSIWTVVKFEENDINIAQPVFDKICRQIEQTYNCVKFECEYHEMFRGNTRPVIYYVYSKNNNKKIGEIHISYTSFCHYDIYVSYEDLINSKKFNKDYNPGWLVLDGKQETIGTLSGIENLSKVVISKKQGSDALYLDLVPSNKEKKIIKYILYDKDKDYFNNYLKTCNSKVSYYFLNLLLNYTDDPTCIHIFHNTLECEIESYYEQIETEKQKQIAKQQKQRRSFGFMDLMHMLAPGFFTQDDVDLWNKMPEENQKAVINGTLGAFGSMGGSTWDSLSPEQKMQIHQNDNAR